ncbi:MAG: ABC transporter ATP-binding protein [Firmicutes bacterium]|nr:ABC transporter ATP-binding protein [Bacillota bacterium]
MNARQWLNEFAKPHKRDGIFAVGAAIGLSALLLVPPALTRILVNQVLIGRDPRLLIPLILAALVFSVLRGAAMYIQTNCSERLGQSVLQKLRESLYAHLASLSFSYYDQVQTGQLISRLTSDVELVRIYYSNFYPLATNVAFQLAFITLAILVLDWRLGVALVALVPALLWLITTFNRRVHPAFHAIRETFAKMTIRLNESVAGVRVVKAFGQESREAETFDHTLDHLFQRNLSATALWAQFFPLFDLLGGIYGMVVFVYGAWQTIHGTLSVGSLVAIASYALMLVNPLRQIGQVLNMSVQATAAAERLYELWLIEPAIQAPAVDPYRPSPVRGHIVFEDVSLTYPTSERPSLQHVSFELLPGRSLAVLGPTGSGKSSLCLLVPRLYDVTAGRVLVDGRDVREWDPVWLRRHIGFVMQETFLFSATVWDNILFGRPDASREEVLAASRAAQADDFIQQLPRGYDTIVGERGVGLSGGQRQRIAIARALLMDPPIVILDDATASVDQETEVLIQQALSRLLAGRTAIVIGHRLSSLKAADEILVLDQGIIRQRGRHETLLQEDGLYREIYRVQFRDQEAVRRGVMG